MNPETQNAIESADGRPSATTAGRTARRSGVFRWLIAAFVIGTILTGLWWTKKPLPQEESLSTIQIQQTSANESRTDLAIEGESGDLVGSTETHADAQSAQSLPEPEAESIEALINDQLIAEADHPLDPLLEVACWSIMEIEQNIVDYTATVTSQVFVDGALGKERVMDAKIRHRHGTGENEKPFSVYLHFLEPRANRNQEVIWVEGQNDGKLIAHGTGLFKVKRMYLDPNGPIAMRGSRYPVWDIGFKNLIEKMLEIGRCDREQDDCQVKVTKGVVVEDRHCTLLEIVHEQPLPCFMFHHAKIYIDDERHIPIGYEGYMWPKTPGEPPPLLEKFYYTDIKLNPGLTDRDFDPDNPDYDYPRW